MLSPSSLTTRIKPSSAEWLAVLSLICGMFILNICTYRLYAAVWADDVLWSEPAINLARTGHFTTSVWYLQPAGTFWAAQSPLYPLTLSLWVRLAGSSLLAVRSFNLFLVTIAAFLVWTTAWRFRLVLKPIGRLGVVALTFLGYGLSFSYRCSRPDIAGMICLLGLALAFSERSRSRRILFLLGCSALAPWVGVQVALYAVCACFLAKI